MNTQVSEIINKLLKHDLTKRQAIEQLSKLVPEQQAELPLKQKLDLSQRKLEFDLSILNNYKGVYDWNMLREFFHYWSEPNKSHTKMRFEMEKTWNLKGRLATWKKNAEKFDAKFKDKNGKSVMEQLNDIKP